MARTAIRCSVLVVILGVASLDAVSQRATFGRPKADSRGGTVFDGRADRWQPGTERHVYEGNVVMAFPDAQITIRADKATWEGRTVSLEGNVQVTLDAKP
jgi:hypothetical protein